MREVVGRPVPTMPLGGKSDVVTARGHAGAEGLRTAGREVVRCLPKSLILCAVVFPGAWIGLGPLVAAVTVLTGWSLGLSMIAVVFWRCADGDRTG